MAFSIPGQPDAAGAPAPATAPAVGLLQKLFGGLLGGGAPSPAPAPPAALPPGVQGPVQPPPAPAAMPQAPAQQQLSGLQRLLIGLGDFGAGVQGQAGPSQLLAQRRLAEAQQRTQQYQQNLQYVGQLGKSIDALPLDQREAALAKGRQQAVAFGGEDAGSLYDVTVANRGLGASVLAELQRDPIAARAIASGASYSDLAEMAKSEPFLARAAQRQDRALLPQAEAQLRKLMQSKDPAVRAAFQGAAKDGTTTFEELRQIADQFGTQGPNGNGLTEAMWDSISRNQDALSQRFGQKIVPDETFKKRQEAQAAADLSVDTEKRKDQNKADIEAGLAVKKAAAKGPDLPGEAEMRKEFNALSGDFIKIRDAGAKIDAVLKKGTTSAAADMSLIFNYMKLLDPGSSVREGEQATAENARGIPASIIAVYEKARTGKKLAPDQVKDFAERAKELYDAQLEKQIQLEGQYRATAERSGLRPDNVVLDHVGKSARAGYEERKKSLETQAAQGKPKTVTQNGHTYVLNEATGKYE